MYKCLSIAGFDGSGGAGIQADLKTFSALGCYGMNALTALPVQNTCGVRNVYELPLSCVQEQLEAIFDDITPDAIKIGMLFSKEIIDLLSKFLKKEAAGIPLVLDPVMVAKSGDSLLQPEAIAALKDRLIPLATIITPNIPEAHTLVGINEKKENLMLNLLNLGAKSVLLKGGHASGEYSNDFFLSEDGLVQDFVARRIPSKNTHGTGCTLSAAICAYLAKGVTIQNACHLAKKYVYGAIEATKNYSIGKGNGPLNHLYLRQNGREE